MGTRRSNVHVVNRRRGKNDGLFAMGWAICGESHGRIWLAARGWLSSFFGVSMALHGFGDPWWENLLALLGAVLVAAFILSRSRRWQ